MKRYRTPLVLALFCLVFLAIGCKSNTTQTTAQSTSQIKDSLTTQEKQNLQKAQNDFAITLFQKTAQAGENILLSPLSIYMDLAMLYNGASGKTQQQMQRALQLQEKDVDALNLYQRRLLEELAKADTAVQMDIANSIWFKEGLQPQADFKAINKKFYHAKIKGMDFSDPETKTTMNDWVSEKTQGKIPTIIDEIKSDDSMFLLNAVYFNGNWATPFDPEATQEQIFYSAEKEEKVPLMSKKSRYNYGETEGVQAIELPYGEEKYNMTVVLPDKEKDLSTFLAEFDAAAWEELQKHLKMQEVKLQFPKWELSYAEDSLKEQLGALGMADAFTNKADFSNLFKEESAKISEVKHKTYIKVDEEGTEAAGATSTGITTTSYNPNQPEMKVNRPFIYLITEKDSGQILFIGQVNNPVKE